MKLLTSIFFTLVLLGFAGGAYSNPPYSGTIWVDLDIITAADPSAFIQIVSIESGPRVMFDRRADNENGDWVTINPRLFQASYTDGNAIEIQVNPEFDPSEAAIKAKFYGYAIGQLPKLLRLDVKTVWIHKGDKPFGGGNDNILIHTDGLGYHGTALEETLFHEACHTSLDSRLYGAAWSNAQTLDAEYISTYAKDNPAREDVAESCALYYAVRFKPERLSEIDINLITKTIKNRMLVFDSLGMEPVTDSDRPLKSTPSVAIAQVPQIERDALVALYNSTDGANWTDNTGWLGEAGTECSWFGVTCSNGSVRSLSISNNALTGTIPSELGNLTNLTGLYLNNNSLSGTIPVELGNLTNLIDLRLYYNSLSGSIPVELGNLTNLNTLYLMHNSFSGSIPTSFGNLTKLTYLSLSDNSLSGSIPVGLGNLTNLIDLRLSNNSFSLPKPNWLENSTLEILEVENAFQVPESERAAVTIQHLIFNGSHLKEVLDLVGSAKVLKYYIFDQPDSSFEKAFMQQPHACNFASESEKKPCTNRIAEDWQNKIIRDANNQLSGILGIKLVEVETESESDFFIIIHNNRDQDFMYGGISQGVFTLNMSWGSGIPKTPLGLKHSVAQKKMWQKIYIHELGHVLGLEHPWDKGDGDWAVDSSSAPTEDTVMAWTMKNSNGEIYTWFAAIDINALTKIWGLGEWPSPYNGVTPDSSYGLEFNNVGVLNSADATIYVCLRIFTDGLPSSVNGISQFDMGLKVASLSEVTVQITKFREFNAISALNEKGQTPDCSGVFETTTGVYTDIIQTDSSVLETTWNLIDPTNLILKLDSFKELSAN